METHTNTISRWVVKISKVNANADSALGAEHLSLSLGVEFIDGTASLGVVMESHVALFWVCIEQTLIGFRARFNLHFAWENVNDSAPWI